MGAPELPGSGLAAAHVAKQLGVELPDEPQRKGQGLQPLDTVLQGRNIVLHLADFIDAFAQGTKLVEQQLGQGCASALDP